MAEVKQFRQILDNGTTSDPGLVNQVVGMIRGVEDEDRVGLRVRLRHLSLRLKFSAGTDTGHWRSVSTRVIVFYDKQSNFSLPNYYDFLDASVTGNLIIAPYNRDEQDRFVFLHDSVVTCEVLAEYPHHILGSAPILQVKYREIEIPLNLPVVFNNTDVGVPADWYQMVATNNLYVYLANDSDSNIQSCYATSILDYTDE